MKLGFLSRAQVVITRPIASLMLRSGWMRKKMMARCEAAVAEGLNHDFAVMWGIDEISKQGHFWKFAPAKARRKMRSASELVNRARPEFAAIQVNEVEVAGETGSLRARTYAAATTTGSAPCIVFFHGGGWVVGDLDTHDDLCRNFAARGRVRVIAVDYRLAPENPFPAAARDAIAAFRNIVSRANEFAIDTARVAVAGDSAGGNLSAVVAIATRDERVAPRLQVLIYPAVDATRSLESHRRFAETWILNDKAMSWYLGHYIGQNYSDDDPLLRDPLLSPLHASDEALRKIAPAHVIVAGFDPLHDEGVAFAKRLQALGVPAELFQHPSMVHGFCLITEDCSEARQITDAMCERTVATLTTA